MEHQKENCSHENDLLGLSPSDLNELYQGTVEELRLCADHIPNDEDCESDMDAREGVLLDFEARLIETAAKVPLRSSEDVHAMIGIWEQLSGVHDSDMASPSDRLILNVKRSLFSEPALKKNLFVA